MTTPTSPYYKSWGETDPLSLWPNPSDSAAAAAAAAADAAVAAAAAEAAAASVVSASYNVYNVTKPPYNAPANCQTYITTATVAAGSRILNVGASIFSSADVGKLIMVCREDVAHALTFTKLTITAYYSPTSVQLSGTPYNVGLPYGPVSGQTCRITVGSDASPGIQAALDAALAAGGGEVYLPPGRYALGATLAIGSKTRLFGSGYSSELVACGVGWQNQPLTGDGPIIVNKDVRNNPQTAGNFDFSPDFRVDSDITLDNFRITTDGAVPQTQKCVSFTMAKRIRCLRLNIDVTSSVGLNGIACPGSEDVLIWECRVNNVSGDGAGFDFWKGTQDIKIIGNIVRTRPNGANQVININAIGTDYDDAERSDYFQIVGNRIEMNGAGGGELVAIYCDGLRPGSPTTYGVIANNTIIGVSGIDNCGIIARTEGGYLHIYNNTLIRLGGDQVERGVIRLHSVGAPSGTALTAPASVVNGSNIVTVSWPNHKITAFEVTNGTWVFVPVNFGGITFTGVRNGFHKVLSVVDANTITIQAPSNATSTASGLGTGTWTLWNGPTHGNSVISNTIIDPIRPGFSPIDIGGYDNICIGNKVVVTSGSPNYGSLINIWSHTPTGGTPPAVIADNFGPSGTGVPSGSTGDTQISWRTGTAMPFIRHADITTGFWRFISPVDISTLNLNAVRSGASYANDAAAASGGVGLGQVYRNGSALQIRVT